MKNIKIKNLISSDLNNNQQPEFWIFGDDNAHKFQIFGYEFNKNSFNLIKDSIFLSLFKNYVNSFM